VICLGQQAVALYGDNGGMKRLPAFSLMPGQELKTPLANYNQLPAIPHTLYVVDPDTNIPVISLCLWRMGSFVLVKQITSSPPYTRAPTSRNYLIPETWWSLSSGFSSRELRGRFLTL